MFVIPYSSNQEIEVEGEDREREDEREKSEGREKEEKTEEPKRFRAPSGGRVGDVDVTRLFP